jgi:hypothetical protein
VLTGKIAGLPFQNVYAYALLEALWRIVVMKKIAALAGVAALGLSAQTALGYTSTASVTFTIGGSTLSGATGDQGFVSSGGPIVVSSMTNSTLFHTLAGANSNSQYNSNFVVAGDCTIGGAYVPAGSLTTTNRKYGCRYTDPGSTALFAGTTAADGGPLAQASGTLNATDTTLTGTLTIVNTSDEPTGGTTTISTAGGVTTRLGTGILGFPGFNYRTADGSPFGNVWYGVTNSMVLNVNVTGTFTAASWVVDGGYVTWSDPNFACQQGGFGGDDRGTLCSASTTGGGFQPDGGHLGWGLDPDGVQTGTAGARPITVNLAGGGSVTLAGMIANLSLDASGNITTNSGEFRRASGSSPSCISNIVYDTASSKITCGSLTSGNLAITGVASTTVIPVPAAGWLLAPAVLAVGRFMRRRKAS